MPTLPSSNIPIPATHALGPYPLLRGQQVSSEDVIIDTFVSEPQGKGALDEDRPRWVVVGQGSLLIRSLDSWCGDTQSQGALADGLCPEAPGSPPSKSDENPATPCQSLTYNVGLGGICCTCGVCGRRHLQGGVGVEACGPQPL